MVTMSSRPGEEAHPTPLCSELTSARSYNTITMGGDSKGHFLDTLQGFGDTDEVKTEM